MNIEDALDYNPETGDLTWKVDRGSRARKGAVAGCPQSQGYRQVKLGGKTYRSHRVAFYIMEGRRPTEQIDHINGVRDDNRWCNLREAEPQENMRNAKQRTDNTSGVTGVAWHTWSQKWRARIKVDSTSKHIGVYEDWFDAVCARKSAEVQYGFHENHGRIV